MPPPGDAEVLDLPESYASLPYEHIRVSHVPESSVTPTPVVVLTLYRPNNYNAFTGTMMAEIQRAFALFDVDPRVKAIVFTGHGKMFCAGADLSGGSIRENESLEKANDHRDGGGRVGLAIHRCRKPVIGAINGHAVGVGITMVLPMTIRVAWKGAKIAFPFARRGIVMEAASAYFLPRLVGYGRAVHLATTGETVTADHQLLTGLFSELLERPEQVLPRALAIAESVVQNTSTVSTAVMADLIWRGPDNAEQSHLLTSRLIADMFSGADHKEGVAAFLQKRQARFTGTLEDNSPDAYPWWDEADIGLRPKAGKHRADKPKL